MSWISNFWQQKPKTKKCSRCSVDLPVVEFARHSKLGFQPWCKGCTNEYRRNKRKPRKYKLPRIYKRTELRRSVCMTVKSVPGDWRQRLQEIATQKRMTLQDLLIDAIKSYLILNNKL